MKNLCAYLTTIPTESHFLKKFANKGNLILNIHLSMYEQSAGDDTTNMRTIIKPRALQEIDRRDLKVIILYTFSGCLIVYDKSYFYCKILICLQVGGRRVLNKDWSTLLCTSRITTSASYSGKRFAWGTTIYSLLFQGYLLTNILMKLGIILWTILWILWTGEVLAHQLRK